MKILIAGFGSIGRRHFHNLRSLGIQDFVFYRTHQSTLDDAELAGFPVETDLQAALDHRPGAVVVANPTALHLDVAIPAALAGCSLLLEKPISHSMERLPELEAALKVGGGQVLVGFQFRFHPGLKQAARWLHEGAIGNLASARAHWGEYLPGWHPWEDYRQSYAARAELGGGVVLTLSHPFDYLRWLVGEIGSLAAVLGRSGGLGVDVEDTAEILLQFASGATGMIHLDYLQRPPEHWLALTGTQGTIRWDNSTGEARLFRQGQQEWQVCLPPHGFERNTLFLEEDRHFLAVARGEQAPLCTLYDGRRALEVALAAKQSSTSGIPVRV